MTKEELKQELYHYIATQCSAISINMEHRLVYHYDQMEKVGEFIYNLEEKRIEELEKELKDVDEKVVHLACNQNKDLKYKLNKAKEIILRLYNAGRDVLMCRAEEKAYDNLENAINDRSIEQFLKEIEK